MPTLDVDLRAGLGPVRDQGIRSTCLAHATSAAHEHVRADPTALSVEYLHFFASGGAPALGCTFDDTGDALMDEGQPLETECAYSASPPATGWLPPATLQVFRRDATQPVAISDEVKKAIVSGLVPILGITITQSFLMPAAPWVIPNEQALLVRHAVAAVGLSESAGIRRFLVRNSWGASWADGGHAWLEEDYLDDHLEELLVLASAA